MKRSLSSVLVVFGSLFFACFISWAYLRGKAQDKTVKAPFSHPFLSTAHPSGKPLLIVAVSSPEKAKNVPAEFDQMKTAIWLDVRLGGESQLVVSESELLSAGPLKGKPIEIATRADCKSAGLFELPDFFAALKDRLVVLNLVSRRPGLSDKILEVWGEGKPLSIEMVALQSESDGTMKELREKQPRGLYGSSQAVLLQMEILNSIGLQGLMDLKADLLVSNIEETQKNGKIGPRIRPATLEEAHRRGLKRYVGPVRSKEIARELISLGYDGILIQSEVLDSI